MKKLLSIIAISIMCVSIVACNDSEIKDIAEESKHVELSTEEKVEDFEYMFEVIKEGYPFLEVNKRLYGIDWVANKEKYLEKIKNTKDDKEFVNEMSNILMELKDGHTHLVYDEGIYEFVKEAYQQSGWYDFFNDEKVENRYKSIGYTKGDSEELMPTKDIIVKDVVNDKVGYIYMPQMYTEGDVRENQMKEIKKYIDTLENHQALIIDIRGNTGGDDGYWKEIVSNLINKDMKRTGYMLFRNNSEVMKNYTDKRNIDLQPITNLPKNVLEKAPKEVLENFSEFNTMSSTIYTNYSSKFKGNIYLLVDEKVYSSAESFSIFCKENKFATIIGKTTGGGGGGVDPVLFELENSGLIVRMSSDMYLTDSGICNEEFKTVPDYEVEECKRTEKFENDKCIEKVLELENIK